MTTNPSSMELHRGCPHQELGNMGMCKLCTEDALRAEVEELKAQVRDRWDMGCLDGLTERLDATYGRPGDDPDGEAIDVLVTRALDERAALRAEVERLSVFHADDEPSWRHRAEALEQENAALRAEMERLKEDALCKTVQSVVRPVPILDIEECEGCVALRAKLAEAEGHLSRIAEWSQEQQDKLDLDTAIAMWRGCVGEANMALAAIREEKP